MWPLLQPGLDLTGTGRTRSEAANIAVGNRPATSNPEIKRQLLVGLKLLFYSPSKSGSLLLAHLVPELMQCRWLWLPC